MPASILSDRTTRNRLDCLPNEILEIILSFCCGVITLFAFTKANAQAQALFERRPHAFLTDAIKCSPMDSQLQKMLCSIISIRQRRKGQVADEAFRAFVQRTLRDQSNRISFELSGIQPAESMETLAVAASLCNFVTEAEKSFIKVRLPKAAAKMQAVVTRDRIFNKVQRPFTLNYRYQHPSITELHRIRRALWRVCLYLEAFYTPYLSKSNNEHEEVITEEFTALKTQSKPTDISPIMDATFLAKQRYIDHPYIYFQECFFRHMTVWELEEMDCVWNHLSHKHNTFWHRRCAHCHRSLLPDDLIGHLRERRHHMNHRYEVSDYACNFRDACELFRQRLEKGLEGRTTAFDTAAWSGSLARSSSGGFLFHLDCHAFFNSRGSPPVTCWDRYCSFIDWACCMWDQERIAPLILS